MRFDTGHRCSTSFGAGLSNSRPVFPDVYKRQVLHIAAGMIPERIGRMVIDIGRREFMSALGGAVALAGEAAMIVWPKRVLAQASGETPRIAILLVGCLLYTSRCV